MSKPRWAGLLVLFASALLLACEDDGVAPVSEGDLQVALAMSGSDLDPDGTTVIVDGSMGQSLFAGSGVVFEDLDVGSHIVEIFDLADNCTVVGENPRAITVQPKALVRTTFDVSCGTPTEAMTLADVIVQAGVYQEAEPSHDVAYDYFEEQREGALWSCTTERHSVVDAPDEYATFNPNAEVIYPGSMLQGATLTGATPEPVVVRRAGGTVVINLLNGSSGVAQQVEEVRQSTIVQAVNDILADNTGVVPARFTYKSSQVQSHRQMAMELGVDVKTLPLDLKTQLAFSTDRKYNRMMVQFVQSFYTVSFDHPRSLDELFHPSVTAEDLSVYTGPGNPPTYISSVTYGRRFVLLIETTESVDSLRASVKASYDAAVVETDVDLKSSYVNELENVNIKLFALGGDQSKAAAMFSGELSELKTFLTDSEDIIKTGVPLSYVVRNVMDNTVVNVKVATDYDVTNCVPMQADAFYSGFGSDVEGWTTYWNNDRGLVWETPERCNNGFGGCIRMNDERSGVAMRLRAPAAWRAGSWTQFIGGTISYRARVTGGSDVVGYPRSDLQIVGSAGTLTFHLPRAIPDNLMWGGWTLINVELDSDGTVFNIGGTPVTGYWQVSGHNASDEEMRAVLENVTDFLIRGDYRNGDDNLWVDEVEVTAPAGEPGSGG